jgi:hypothetical protein
MAHQPRFGGERHDRGDRGDRPKRRPHFRNKISSIGNLLLAASIAAAGIYIGCSIQKFRTRDLTVTVKGLSEKVVKSDLAIWTLTYRNGGNELSKLEQKTAEDKKLVFAFLKEKGFAPEEIEEGSVSIVDKSSREWGEMEKNTANRFVLTGSVVLRTQKVELVRQNYAKIVDLIRSGVVISGDPSYHFTKFLDLKQQMLSEASQNAVQAAHDLISPTNAQLKGIRTAQQGTFIVHAKDVYGDEMGNEQGSVEKRIRVVNTVTFNIAH